MEKVDLNAVDRLIAWALEEDIGSGDITTDSVVSSRLNGVGQITAKKPCVSAGLFLVERIFKTLDERVQVEVLVQDGRLVAAGTVLCRMEGPYRALLMGERTVLNFLQRMSGIATLARKMQRMVRHTHCKVLDTRKTTPGMRTLEKYAVACGGAFNHRLGLYDAYLMKENHIAAAGGVDKAIQKARKAHPDKPLEIEVRNMEELVLAVEYGADIVLLDNMSLGEISKAVSLVGDRVTLEVSGGVTQRTLRAIAETGVHRISVGALTHSAPAADLSMLVLPSKKTP